MRIWKTEERSDYPGMALAVALVWTPASWGVSKSQAWISESNEAMRSMFPNLPEVIEGPWGSLPRADVFCPQDACSAMLDAMEGLSLTEGGDVDKSFEISGFVMGEQSLSERVEQGKLNLKELYSGQFAMASHVAIFELQPNQSLYKGDKQAALAKIDLALERVGVAMKRWMPSLVKMAASDELSLNDVECAMALARKCEIERVAAKGVAKKTPKSRL